MSMVVAPGRAVRRLIAGAMLCVVMAVSARAHDQATPGAAPADGISIPTITHGQMVVMADNRAAILDLANHQMPTDRAMRRLLGFINIQYSVCLWGLVPGSLTDEDSPFNACSHAYLAATRTLLLHLQDMPGDRAPVRALVEKIERDMVRNQASLVLCRYSDQSFNTSEIIDPEWRGVPFHVASLVTFSGLAATIVGCGSIAVRLTRSRPAAPSRTPRRPPPVP